MNRNGFPVAGYACSYVPVEVVLAAGFSPRRLVPGGLHAGAEGCTHPNTCSYVKSLLSGALDGSFSRMDTVILANSCDAMRRLFDLWGMYVEKPAALFLDIPKKRDQDSIKLFAAELKRLAGSLSGLKDGGSVALEDLHKSVRQVNTVRTACRELFDALKAPMSPVRGSDVFSLIQGENLLTPSEFRQDAARFIQGHHKEVSSSKRRRLLVAGNILNSMKIPAMIEDAGATIVGFDTCFGMRHYAMDVEEDASDPFEALAYRYLSRPACPRMMGISDQMDFLMRSVKDSNADGVVLSKVKFCDNLTYTIPLIRETLAASGVGCLVLENDYEWSDIEKARIQVETFLSIPPAGVQ